MRSWGVGSEIHGADHQKGVSHEFHLSLELLAYRGAALGADCIKPHLLAASVGNAIIPYQISRGVTIDCLDMYIASGIYPIHPVVSIVGPSYTHPALLYIKLRGWSRVSHP